MLAPQTRPRSTQEGRPKADFASRCARRRHCVLIEARQERTRYGGAAQLGSTRRPSAACPSKRNASSAQGLVPLERESGYVARRRTDDAFDRFAAWAAEFSSHALFFAACVSLVVLWVPSYFIFRNLNTWQLVINTATTIVTFILVALLQNAQRRSDDAVHAKLNALADGLADLMEHIAPDDNDLQADMHDLRSAVGLEKP